MSMCPFVVGHFSDQNATTKANAHKPEMIQATQITIGQFS
jgi:hypothetical protein